MTIIRILLFAWSISMLFSSCGAKKSNKTKQTVTKKTVSVSEPQKKIYRTTTDTKVKVVSKKSKPIVGSKMSLTTLQYIDKFSGVALTQMRSHKIPASITLAQGILESRSGNSDLTKVSNNHFGIKCHKNWQGARTYYDDDAEGECFRVYDEPLNSFNDHSLFLTQRKRYSNLFKLHQSDYKGWAKGLRKAGYATDRQYPQKLIRIIEKYELYKFDEQVLGKRTDRPTQESPKYYIVEKGDGLYTIAKKFGVSLSDIRTWNKLRNDIIFPGQKLLIKQPAEQIINLIRNTDKKKLRPAKEVYTKSNVIKSDTIRPRGRRDTLFLSGKRSVLAPKKEIRSTVPEHKKEITKVFTDVKANTGVKRVDSIALIKKKDSTRLIEKNRSVKPIEVTISTKEPSVSTDTIKQEKPKYHIVEQGETLYQIAYKFDLTIPDIRKWNRIKKDKIHIGQRLRISNPDNDESLLSSNKKHIVTRGETLYSIAIKNGLTVEKLKKLNTLTNNTLSVGQELLLE